MQNSKQNFSHVKANAFIDYKPAELRMNSRWLIVYYSKNPITQQMERQRISVPVLSPNSERIKYAKKIVLEINNKLANGWLPYYDSTDSNDFKTLEFCTNKFIEHTKEEIKKGVKRDDTLRSYTSYVSMLYQFIKEKKLTTKLILEYNKSFATNYLDWIYYERNNTPATHNNHLGFICNFVNFCLERGYLKENFTHTIQRKKNQKKIRQVLTTNEKQKIKELQFKNYGYYTICMLTYFCFVRRTEATKIKVKDIDLKNGYITILGENSKNKKTDYVTIPKAFYPVLIKHLQNANNEDYLFSDDNFNTGKKQLQPKKISDTWEKTRKEMNIEKKYQFYSLKDTGITDLLNTGIPAIKVRDQARHYDLKITESYTSRNSASDEMVLNANFIF